VQYELWHLPPPSAAVAQRQQPGWSGTITILESMAPLPQEGPIWLHLTDDACRLSVRVSGSNPRYVLIGLAGLEPSA
jgi:hypothetical protein